VSDLGGWAAIGGLALLFAWLGEVSNRVRGYWGFLVLPAGVLIHIAFILVAEWIYPSRPRETPAFPSPKDLVNNALFLAFPLVAFEAPPFLVGRFVPRALAAAKAYARRPRGGGRVA
jgi:hypothetical protein